MRVYHYAKLENWQDIVDGSYMSNDKPGLGANLRIGQHDDEAFRTTALFALLEPKPAEWGDNKDFKNIWERLKANMGKLLLEVDIDPAEDEAYVADRGYMQGYLQAKSSEDLPEKYRFNSRVEAERAYMKSKIRLADYTPALGYSLPEVIVLNHIPFDRIHVSEQQPLLEELAERATTPEGERRFMKKIHDIPELVEWYKRYTADKEEKSREKSTERGPHMR